jgi:hypothetical protein
MWFWISFSPIGHASSTSKQNNDLLNGQSHENVGEDVVPGEV